MNLYVKDENNTKGIAYKTCQEGCSEAKRAGFSKSCAIMRSS